MEKIECVELKHFSNEYLDVLNSFELPEEQVQFTALPNKILEAIEGQHRIVILGYVKVIG